MQPTEPTEPTHPGAWTGYAAALWAFAFAVPSLYWGFGGHFLADTVSGSLASESWAAHRALQALVLVTAVLKCLGGLFAVSLVRPSWPQANPRLAVVGGYVLSALLVLYGTVNVIGEALVESGAVTPSAGVDRHALRWHLFLWDPYFAVWGVLLALAVRHRQRT